MFETPQRTMCMGMAVALTAFCLETARAQEAPATQPTNTAVATSNALPGTVVGHALTNAPAPSVPHTPPASNLATSAESAIPTNHPAPAGALPPSGETLITPAMEESSCFWGCWRIGTRYTHFKLKDKTRGEPFNGSFVGTITQIDEEQDNVPNKLYIQYRLPKVPVWLGVSYDHARAVTMDDGNGDGIVDHLGGDGSVDLPGYIAYVQADWENSTRLMPYVQLGYAFYQSEFKPNANWSDSGRRQMNLKDTTGTELAGGVAVRLYKNWSADLFAQLMTVKDVKGDYVLNGQKQQDIIFTMSYMAYGAGVSCTF